MVMARKAILKRPEWLKNDAIWRRVEVAYTRWATKPVKKRRRKPMTHMHPSVKARLRKHDRDNPWGMKARWRRWFDKPENRERERARALRNWRSYKR